MSGSWSSARIVPCALVLVAAAGCGGSDKNAAVCEDLAQLKATVQALVDVPVEKGALTIIQEDLTRTKEELATLESDAKGQFSTEITRLKSELTSLSTSLDAAKASPTAASIAALGVATRDTVSAGKALVSAVADTC